MPRIDKTSPLYPTPRSDRDIIAVRAVAKGNASEEQQRRALKFIVESLCATYDEPYRPGLEGARETDFALGKAHVGREIVKMVDHDKLGQKKAPPQKKSAPK